MAKYWKCPKCDEINLGSIYLEKDYVCSKCNEIILQNDLIPYPYEEDDEDFPDGVELISTGYDWECPNCNNWGFTEEYMDKVHCVHCNKHFDVTGVTNN